MVWPHGDVMRAIAHIDPRRMWMNYLKTWIRGLHAVRPFLSFLPIPSHLHVCHHRPSSAKDGIRFGPVTIG